MSLGLILGTVLGLAILTFIIFYLRRFSSPYKLYMVFGKKGSGKTTYMCRLALDYHKRGWEIYSTIPLPYSHIFSADLIGKFVPPPHSVVLIDEVGMIWDNRDFKNFRHDVRDYFKLQRHYENIVYLFSQTFDIDIKLRNLTDGLFLVTSPISGISILRRIKRTVSLVQPTAESEGRIADSLEFVPFWMNLFGAKAFQFTFIPKYVKYFNSFEAPELPSLQSVSVKSAIIAPVKKRFSWYLSRFVLLPYRFFLKIKKK